MVRWLVECFNASAEKIICFCLKKSVVWRQQSVFQSSIRFFEEWWAKEMGSKPMKRCVCSKRDMVRVGSIVCGRIIKNKRKRTQLYLPVFYVGISLFLSFPFVYSFIHGHELSTDHTSGKLNISSLNFVLRMVLDIIFTAIFRLHISMILQILRILRKKAWKLKCTHAH